MHVMARSGTHDHTFTRALAHAYMKYAREYIPMYTPKYPRARSAQSRLVLLLLVVVLVIVVVVVVAVIVVVVVVIVVVVVVVEALS